MNVTVFPDLAPLEAILVEEIAEHEHGSCEIEHWDDLPCSVQAVGILLTKCEPVADLCCWEVVKYVHDAHADPLSDCGDCDRPCAECWSVVMLP